MNRDNERQSAIILSVIGIIPVVWLALLIAPSVKGGLPEILPSLLTAFNEPFHIELCEDSLKTVLVAVFIPFRVQDIYHENGIYYGQNVISKNMIIADRRQLLNGNSFILGVSGGGKSFAAKGEIENIILSSNADVIIIDPEREYSQLVKALGGEIINISATSCRCNSICEKVSKVVCAG